MRLTLDKPATPSAVATPRTTAVVCIAAAALSALLLNLAYFPAGQGWLAWFALVPWLALVRAPISNRGRYLLAFASALGFFLPALRWMRVAHDAMLYSWIALSLACAGFAPLALWLIRRFDRRHWPLTLSVPIVWTALEFVRTHLFGGFPWYLLGHSQHDLLPLIQIADLVGVPGVTFLVAAVNGLFAEALYSVPAVRDGIHLAARQTRLRRQTAIVVTLLVSALGYGFWRLGHAEFRPGPNVALLQTDLEQSIRNSRGDEPGAQPRSIQDIRAQTAELTRRAVKSQPRPDLIIWPETTFEYDIKERRTAPTGDAEFDAWVQDLPDREALLESVASASRAAVLLGVNVQRYRGPGRIDRFNSAVLLSPAGQTLGRYDKTHLVPFGEYVPLYDVFPFLRHLAPYDDSLALLAAGDQFPRLRIATDRGEYTFGCMICYEDSYAHLAREYLRGPDRPVDFLVNQSNDGWFRCTHEHEEHLAVSRFRAIECRRALVRSANMGISAIIDGDGRIVALPAATWSASKGVMAVVSGAVPIDDRTSVYARIGDVLPWLCWIVIAVALVRPPPDSER